MEEDDCIKLEISLASSEEVHRIEHTLATILKHLERIMATIDQVLQDVTDESTAIDSVVALVDGLKKQIADALSGATLPPDVQAKVDAVFATAEANKGKLAAALAANVPPAPPVP